MNADENRATLSVGDGDPAIEGHESITGTGHDRAQPGIRQIGAKPARDIEGDAFFRDDV